MNFRDRFDDFLETAGLIGAAILIVVVVGAAVHFFGWQRTAGILGFEIVETIRYDAPQSQCDKAKGLAPPPTRTQAVNIMCVSDTDWIRFFQVKCATGEGDRLIYVDDDQIYETSDCDAKMRKQARAALKQPVGLKNVTVDDLIMLDNAKQLAEN